MPALLPIPPTNSPIIDPLTKQVSVVWQNYWQSVQAFLAPTNLAPVDAQYWVSTNNSILTNARNLGALTSGYLKILTVLSIATPSTVTAIPATDISGGAALTRTNDTNVTATLGGAPTTALLTAVSLTLGWTGLLSLGRGGTAADLSGTGGASQVLRQSTVGGAVTVSQLAAADVTGTARVLFDHFADASNGTTVETDLYSDTLAAGQFSANGQKVTAQYGGTFVGDATSTQRLRAYFGGTLIFDTGALGVGVTAASWNLDVTTIRESTSIVRCTATLNTSFATLNAYATYTKVTGLTLANTQVLKITGTAAGVSGASNQITATEGYVQWLAAA